GREAHRYLAGQVGAIAREQLVGIDANLDVEIPRRPAVAAGLALARQADAVAVVDTCGHLDRELPDLGRAPASVAGRAGIGDHGAAAFAGRAGLLDGKEPLLHAHLADAAAGRAFHRLRAFAGAAAVAFLAGHLRRHFD